MNKFRIIIVVTLIFFLVPIAEAHSGRTNSSGCHNNRKTGDYHCHTKTSDSSKSARTSARSSARGSELSICSYNAYNCSDFSSWLQAQNTYTSCLQATGKDIHDLDRDDDGVACETLK